MNRKFISKSNFVLRKVLNSKDNLDILQDFIESILEITIEEIYLNPYLKSKENYLPKEENFGIADVRIKTTQKEELNVGIQIIDGYYVQNKLLLYYVQIHANQLEHDENRKITDTITINILDFIYLPTTKFHKTLELKENIENYKEKDNMKIHLIELPKFEIKSNEKLTKEELWISYLKGKKVNVKDERAQKIVKLDKLLDKYWKQEKME